ncbi:hypothetical protein J7K56_04150 [Candidatus Calescamantes bacterium]|nr:hypothetical protein [Candidatus Calescamantes bacterium]
MIKEKAYHCGLDDTIDIMQEIAIKKNKIKSIFEIEVLKVLKEFNKKYGTKFTLYLFYEKENFKLSDMPDDFKPEWEENSDWLRLSFHARTKKIPDAPYKNASYEVAKQDFWLVKNEILRFAGESVWDNYPRTHYWTGSLEAVKAWRDCGIDGLFYSYPGYPALFFDEERLKKLWNEDFYYDKNLGLIFLPTNINLIRSKEEISKRLKKLRNNRIIEAFCDDYNLLELKENMEMVIKWCIENKYEPAFYEEVFRKEKNSC